MNRAVSVNQITKIKFKGMEFEKEWKESFGEPHMSGTWIIWGNSGNGKTRFSLQLAKYLCQFGRVAYDTLEEGVRHSFQLAVLETGMQSVARQMIFLDREGISDLKERLAKRRSPDVVLIDSLQYTGLTKEEYKSLKQAFPDKLFIFTSHAQGSQPKGSVAEFIRYDADVKICVEGYVAFVTSRYGGGKPFVIWPEGAQLYHGVIPSS